MTDRMTTLLETALQTDNDQEALATLRVMRKHYKGTGTVKAPRRVVRDTVEVPASQDVVPRRSHEAKVAELYEQNKKILSVNQALISENAELNKKLLSENFKADDEVLDAAKEALQKAMFRVIGFGILAFIGFTFGIGVLIL